MRRRDRTVTVAGVPVPPPLLAGWTHPDFDARSVTERARRYQQAVREFAQRHGLARDGGHVDWAALERLGIRRVKAIDRARLDGMVK